jgi:hypothetical protein
MLPELPTDWVSEETLSADLNVPRELLRSLRATLTDSECCHFGAVVAWEKKAATTCAQALGLRWPVVEVDTMKKNAPVAEVLTVYSTPRSDGYHFPNHRIIRALRANGEAVDVSVMDSSKYVTRLKNGQPMTFQAVPSTSGPHWLLVGREPRFTGQW